LNVLIDDQCLSVILRGESIEEIQGHSVHTTGHWYYRLCQAYFRSASMGALSRPFESLSGEERVQAESRILALPDEIGLISMRELAPDMARLVDSHPHLNLLAREALAAALVLDAKVVLNVGSPGLQAALATEGREFLVLGRTVGSD
jgi:hypothetical protein